MQVLVNNEVIPENFEASSPAVLVQFVGHGVEGDSDQLQHFLIDFQGEIKFFFYVILNVFLELAETDLVPVFEFAVFF